MSNLINEIRTHRDKNYSISSDMVDLETHRFFTLAIERIERLKRALILVVEADNKEDLDSLDMSEINKALDT